LNPHHFTLCDGHHEAHLQLKAFIETSSRINKAPESEGSTRTFL
jgi:hypothetical protein